MAKFEAKEFSFSDIHNGERYQNGDIPDAESINKPIEASKYAVDLSRLAIATAEGNKEGGSVGEEYLKIFATKDGEHPNMTAGKLGGRWSTENIVDGVITNPTQNGVYLCYVSANGSLYTSIVFATAYHNRSYGTTSYVVGDIKVLVYYESSSNRIIPYASSDASGTVGSAIIGYYKII